MRSFEASKQTDWLTACGKQNLELKCHWYTSWNLSFKDLTRHSLYTKRVFWNYIAQTNRSFLGVRTATEGPSKAASCYYETVILMLLHLTLVENQPNKQKKKAGKASTLALAIWLSLVLSLQVVFTDTHKFILLANSQRH